MSTASAFMEEIDRRIRARVAVTAIETQEERRALILMRVLAEQRHSDKPLYVWSIFSGLARLDDQQLIPDTHNPSDALAAIKGQLDGRGLFVLCDLAPHLDPANGREADILARQLRELAWELTSRRMSVFILGPSFPTLPSLEKEVHVMSLPLPDREELAAMLATKIKDAIDAEIPVALDDQERDELVSATIGLTAEEAETALALATVSLRGIRADAIPLVLQQKREVIRKSGSLEFRNAAPLESFGGYEPLVEMVRAAAETFRPDAQAFGIEPHKGFLLVGPPGCGKSKLMEVISGVVMRPLIRLSLASVMAEGGGIIGQSTTSLKHALQLADRVQPVLGIDEYEKGAGGTESSARSDAGETMRTMSLLLTWQAEQAGTMVVATANDVRQLRPEQIREGRFGAKVWVGLPNEGDRAQIFAAHLRQRGRDPKSYDLGKLAQVADRFSGAEIEQAVKNGLLRAWRSKHADVTQADLLSGVKDIVPTGVVNRAQIEELERWAADTLGAVDASDRGPRGAQRASQLRPIEV